MKRFVSQLGLSSQNMIVLLGIILTLVVIVIGTAMEGHSQKASAATKSDIHDQIENEVTGMHSNPASDSLVGTRDSTLLSKRVHLAITTSMAETNK